MPTPAPPLQNHLLAALPRADYERFAPELELVHMNLGHALYESGAPSSTSISP